MEEILKYLTKTTNALYSLEQATQELEHLTLDELQEKTTLQNNISALKQEIYDKAEHIDNIIKNLNGVLE